jgi:DNA-binding transcriptional LysR family regulator
MMTSKFSGGMQARTWYFIDQAGHRHPFYAQGRVGINRDGAVLDAALNGKGIAWLPDLLVSETLRKKRLVEVLPDVGKANFPIHALWPKSNHLSREVRRVVDLLAERFLKQMPWEWKGSSSRTSHNSG